MVSLNRDTLSNKVLEGERISSDEAIELYSLPLEELGALADVRRNLAKEKSYGGRGREIVTYNARSEERRVGKEGKRRRAASREKKKKMTVGGEIELTEKCVHERGRRWMR